MHFSSLKSFSLIMLAIFISMPSFYAEEKSTTCQFKAFDVFIDSGIEKLGAYQINATYDSKTISIVGLEGGEVDAFKNAPHHDPKGKTGGRIVIAAFTSDEKKAPKGKTRVLRIHLAVKGAAKLNLKLMTAANTQAERIQATVSHAAFKETRKKEKDDE